MTRQYLPLKIDNTGKTSVGTLNADVIDNILGHYIPFENVSIMASDNYFTIPYTSREILYDRFSPAIVGGSSEATITTIETYVCPTRVSGAVTFADVFTIPTFTVDNVTPANLCYIRMKDRQPVYYIDGDGYQNEMYLLFGFTPELGITPLDATHYFFFTYTDKDNPGNFLQVPNADPSLVALVGSVIDMYVPTSLNFDKVSWSANLYQMSEVFKQPQIAPSPVLNVDFSKNSYTISADPNEWIGAVSINSIDITNVLPNKTIFGYLNGQEVSVMVTSLARPPSTIDIIINISDPPATAGIYWNGSSLGNTPLGSLQENDIIRIYVPVTI